MVLGGTPVVAAPICGDVNDVGGVTSTDALLVLKVAVGQPISLFCEACGDGVIDSTEDCDIDTLDGETCVSLGFAGGTLSCSAGCLFDLSGCYAARFDASGPTIVDHETGLQWEKKDSSDGAADLSNPHDVDNEYSWSVTTPVNDGTVFSDFLGKLNGASNGVCYKSYCDWRLPLIDELLTIKKAFGECSVEPCVIDPVFLPSTSQTYWSNTTNLDAPGEAWGQAFGSADPGTGAPFKTGSFSVRAVRSL
jgi:hypothetical protein